MSAVTGARGQEALLSADSLLHPGKRYLDWQIPDPGKLDLDGVRRVRDDIRGRVEALIAELVPAR